VRRSHRLPLNRPNTLRQSRAHTATGKRSVSWCSSS
jgi:hypothetical protein